MSYHRVTRTVIAVLFICFAVGAGFRIEADAAPLVATSSPVHLSQNASVPVVSPQQGVIVDERPRSLTIPVIALDREIIDVGITDEGNLDVPPNYTQVGWYKYGTLPGQVGSAVLDGHVDNGSTIPGPFKRLREVNVGDDIFVTAADGTKLHYVVTQSKVYMTTEFPGELVFHDKSGKLLKIITCHGRFVKSMDTYDQRLIVTAKLAN